MQLAQIYKCSTCAFAVEVVNSTCDCEGKCACTLQCCDQPMQLMQPKTADAGKEKHLPVCEPNPNGITVKVGSVPHPMQDDHYIEWIEVINGPYLNRKYLKTSDPAEASFYVPEQPGLQMRAYCNKHGLWQS